MTFARRLLTAFSGGFTFAFAAAPLVALCVSFAFSGSCARAQDYTPGEAYFGRNNYIEYRAGDLPLIITTGHGGNLTPSEIAVRTWGTSALDTNTRELAIAMVAEIYARTGRRPHLIINHLSRTRLDPNREIVEAAQGNVYAEQAWREFHGFIGAARKAAEASAGFGFVIDVHGHGHSIARLELGYLLGSGQLNLSDEELSRPGYMWHSSLRSVALAHPGTSLPDLVRGPRSLGELFVGRSRPAWPSATYPTIGTASFFSGGYITATHTCIDDNGTVNGVQIETNYTGVRNTAASRTTFGQTFAQVIQPYLYEKFGYSIGALSLYRFAPVANAITARGGVPVTITIERSGYISYSASVELALGGTAVLGTDYTISTTTFPFASNATSASVVITPLATGSAGTKGSAFGDRTIEISFIPKDTQTIDPTPVVLTLGDGVSQIVRVEPLVGSIIENIGSKTNSAGFRVTRTRATGALSVPLVWTGEAVAGVDYVANNTTAEFADGASEVIVPFTVRDDGVSESDKILRLLILAGAGHVTGIPATAEITIRDDDRHPALVAWYPGNITNNQLIDVSGNNRHATTLPARRGPFSQTIANAPAAVFGGIEDTVALPRTTLDSAAGFTLAFSFRIAPGATAANQNLINYGERGAGGSVNAYLINATTLRTWINPVGGTVAASALDLTGNWMDGTWRHYALTVSAGGQSTVLINGVPMKSTAGWSGRLASTELLWLGWLPEPDASTAFLNGGLRDLRIFSRPLENAEVSAIANGRLRFAAWRAQWSLPTNTVTTADPLSTGRPVLLDYALGVRPGTTGTPVQSLRFDGERLVLDFSRQATAADISWTVEATSDLAGSWQTLATLPVGTSTWTSANGVTLTETSGLVTVRDSQTNAAGGARFLRVRATQ